MPVNCSGAMPNAHSTFPCLPARSAVSTWLPPSASLCMKRSGNCAIGNRQTSLFYSGFAVSAFRGTSADNHRRETGKRIPRFAPFAMLLEAAQRMKNVASLSTLDELRQHVLDTLCTHDRLDPGQAPLRQAVMAGRAGPVAVLSGARPVLAEDVCCLGRRGGSDPLLRFDGIAFSGDALSEGPDPRRLAA